MQELTRGAVHAWANSEVAVELGVHGAYAFLRALAEACRAGHVVDVGALTPFPDKGRWILSWVIDRAESKFMHSWHGDEWEMLCEVRSGLEFFFTLWGQGPNPESESNCLYIKDLDDMLRDAAERGCEGGLPADRIPPGTPRSHWWWWL